MRSDGRDDAELRTLRLQTDFTENPLASVLCELGRTKVLCNVTGEESVPRFLQGSGRGWVTAEYSMLPAATDTRTEREASRGRVSGRTQEIQRLIGRSLRAVVDLEGLGERTFWVDCDVLQADGGTRTASITGAYTALALALSRLAQRGLLARVPLLEGLAAISVGIVEGRVLLDLCYEEDSRADVDLNVVATASGRLAEVQGTGESATFSPEQLAEMTAVAMRGIAELTRMQDKALADAGRRALMSATSTRAYREVVVATTNLGKLLEFRAILGELPLSLRALDAFPEVLLPEEGEDYEANAVAKARAAARGSGRPAIADDSGIEVDALDGAPGPLSARYGGDDLDDAGRVQKLLTELSGRAASERGARFVCVASLALPEGDVWTARGECAGRILDAPRGGGGFGYDPVFEPEGLAKSMAELPPERKHAISHRGRALAELHEAIRKQLL